MRHGAPSNQFSAIETKMRERATEIMTEGKASRVLAWKKGVLTAYPEPGFFEGADELDELVYNRFCSVNLSKFLINAGKEPGNIMVFLRPCDSFSLNQLLKENQVRQEKLYVVGIGCGGCVKVENGEEKGMLEGCRVCTKTTHPICDELIGEDFAPRETSDENVRFEDVIKLENASSEERFDFWRSQLSRCIRCNACRNTCPTCHCRNCVFDSEKYDSRQKVSITSFEDQMFHIIRAYHVAGRCTDCGQCVNVCPQNIPLQLLNRKFIKDINELYGRYQAGENIETPSPLTHFELEG